MLINYTEYLHNPFFTTEIKKKLFELGIFKAIQIRKHYGCKIVSLSLSNNPIGKASETRDNDDYGTETSAGTSVFINDALFKAVFEGIERMSSNNHFLTDNLIKKNIDNKINFVRCHNDEICSQTYKEIAKDTPAMHTEVYELANNNKITHLPAELVHMMYHERKSYFSKISTGTAFHTNKTLSIYKALLEVIERDSMMRFWYSKFENCTRVDLDEYTNYELNLIKNSLKNEELHTFEISSNIKIPVFLTIVKSPVYPYYAVGVSCNNCSSEGILKSIEEAISISYANLTRQKWMNFDFENFDFHSINNLEKHCQLYANWENCSILEELINKDLGKYNENLYPYFIKEKPKKYEDLLDISSLLKEKKYNVYYKDLTINPFKKNGYISRVVIPEAIPLSQSYERRWLSNLGIDIKNKYPQPFS